jgi:hypothetical protein
MADDYGLSASQATMLNIGAITNPAPPPPQAPSELVESRMQWADYRSRELTDAKNGSGGGFLDSIMWDRILGRPGINLGAMLGPFNNFE